MVGDVHQAAVDRRTPPRVGPPSLAHHAGRVQHRARLRRSDHEAGDVELPLLPRMLGGEVAQRIEHAALQSRRRMRQVEVIEVPAAIAGEGHHLAVQLALFVPEQCLHDVAQRHDPEATFGDLPQVGCERLEVVCAVVVPADARRLVGEDGDSHERWQRYRCRTF